MEKMILTDKLANRLLKDLASLMISANGGYPEEGFTAEEMERIEDWTKETFAALCCSFENENREWEVVEAEEEEE